MTKRGKIAFSDTVSVFRVSRPGVDVDTAAAPDLLLHESQLFSQVMQSGFIANPGSPFIVDLAIGYGMANNVNVFLALDFGDVRSFPANYIYATGTSLPSLEVFYSATDDDTIRFTFASSFIPGLYYMLTRRP